MPITGPFHKAVLYTTVATSGALLAGRAKGLDEGEFNKYAIWTASVGGPSSAVLGIIGECNYHSARNSPTGLKVAIGMGLGGLAGAMIAKAGASFLGDLND